MAHSYGDDVGKTRGSGTTLSKQTTQGNLQEGATVAMMCRSVHGGLTPTLRAHGGVNTHHLLRGTRGSDSQGGLHNTVNSSIIGDP